MIQNKDISDIFNEVAERLELDDANTFRIRAYRNAARTISELPRNVSEIVNEGENLTELPGIGKDLAEKIKEIVDTGKLAMLNKLRREVKLDISGLRGLPGLGPKRIKQLHEKLGITNPGELEEAARNKKIRELEGFGEKTERSIIEALEEGAGKRERIRLIDAEKRVESLLDYLKQEKGIEEIEAAGSFRRRKETVGDLDILAAGKNGNKLIEHFVNYEDVENVVSKGKTRSTVVLRNGLQVDLRVVRKSSWGAAMVYFTGSRAHNVAVRKRGQARDLKINEYGVYKGKKLVAGKTEEDVYGSIDLPLIPPELRENRGEIEAAEKDTLPELITLEDIRGDLHMHTDETDGKATLKEMAESAKNKGYEYIAVTDHSKRVTVAKGMGGDRLKRQMDKIDRLNDSFDDFRILKGIEVDILEDGSLDLPEEILKLADITVCSVHYNQNLSYDDQTRRILKAMENPYFNILAHPTGRLINERGPYDADMEKIMKKAVDRGCFMELDGHPDRLDLNDQHCKMAKEMGLKVSISTDSHSTSGLEFMRFGIYQARRGWLESGDVINTLTWKKLKTLLKKDG